MKSSRWCVAVSFAVGMFILPACGGARETNVGVMMSPDVMIDGQGFKIAGDRPFELPYVLGVWKQTAKDEADLPNLHTKWEERGAQRVRVAVTGKAEPLYGVISFHKLPQSATGPATRSFSIHVDHSYIDQATDGRIAVVYELSPLKGGGHAYAWVLWMSDRPF